MLFKGNKLIEKMAFVLLVPVLFAPYVLMYVLYLLPNNNVEAYLSINGPVKAGLPVSECQVYGFQHRNVFRAIRKSLFTTNDFEFQHVVKPKNGLF